MYPTPIIPLMSMEYYTWNSYFQGSTILFKASCFFINFALKCEFYLISFYRIILLTHMGPGQWAPFFSLGICRYILCDISGPIIWQSDSEFLQSHEHITLANTQSSLFKAQRGSYRPVRECKSHQQWQLCDLWSDFRVVWAGLWRPTGSLWHLWVRTSLSNRPPQICPPDPVSHPQWLTEESNYKLSATASMPITLADLVNFNDI